MVILLNNFFMKIESSLLQIIKVRFDQDKRLFLLIGLSLVFNFLTWFFILINFWGFDQPIILHANILFGIDSVGHWQKLLILPLLGLGIFVIHFVLIFYSNFKQKYFFINLLNFSLLIIEIILLISVILVINL